MIWAEAEIERYTKRNIIVRYAGELARLDREALWEWWAVWRRVRFVSSRDGRIAQAFDVSLWWQGLGAGSGDAEAEKSFAPETKLLAALYWASMAESIGEWWNHSSLINNSSFWEKLNDN